MKLKDKREEKNKKQYWQLFLVDRLKGYEGSFEDYYKENKRQSKQNTMTYDEKETEEQRIINKVQNIDFSKLKEKEVII